MGEIAEMMLDGTMCECCGEYLPGEAMGVPRYCSSQCSRERGALYNGAFNVPPPPARSDNMNCPICMKRVRIVGLGQHMQAKHKSRPTP